MKQKIKILVIALCVPCFAALMLKTQPVKAQTTTPPAQTQVETAGQKFKNIKVLTDMPADQMGKVMNLIAASLGVNCNFCHVPDQFEKDDKKEKQTAREMMKMTFEINKGHFDGKTEVTCNSCHNGHEHPSSVPELIPPPAEERPAQPAVKPTTDQVLAKYFEALGGTAKLEKITSRQIKANRVEADGKSTEPEAILFKANKYTASITYPKAVVSEGFDGTDAWKVAPRGPIALKADEAEQIKREAELFSPMNLKTIYAKLDFRFLTKLDGREVYLMFGTTAGGVRERLFFDVQTGYLVRRSAATQTVFGNYVYQVDYSDYKDFGGVKIPTTIRYAMPNIHWTRQLTEVKNNVQIEDARFAKP